LELKPLEIRILNFDTTEIDWSVLKALQERTEGPESPKPVRIEKPARIENHRILGTWTYTHQGKPYSREFTPDGFCIFREGKAESWKKAYTIQDEKTAIVEGGLRHVLEDGNTLSIEGRYRAKRQ